MPRLRHSTDSEPGYTRRRRGRGFSYHDHRGRLVTDPALKERFASLAIPPAWTDVWICRSSRGHLQATGRDGAGRRQYIYHPGWEEERQRDKYERILRFAESLPALRREVDAQLRRRTLDRDRAMAAAVELLDRTHIRVGSEQYAEQNRSFGLATLRSRHVRMGGSAIRLRYRGKGGAVVEHTIEDSPALARAVAQMDDLPGDEVLSYVDGDGRVVDVRSSDVNAWLKERIGEQFSAKDFRTWAGTVAAAVALDEVGPLEGTAKRRRAVAEVCRTAAELLGNTPAVCRASYIDPRVIDHYLDGRTISSLAEEVERRLNDGHSADELAVLALLRRGIDERG
jgi:DNA topoisomerase I